MSVVGVLGGTFDPVHRGHLALARHARRVLGVERVLLLPCADPPHKPERTLAERFHRLEMLYLALEGWEGLGVSTYEIARGGLCYSIDTLRTFRHSHTPGEPVFLIGSDALADIESWREHEALLAEFDFAVAVRPEHGAGPAPPAWPQDVAARLSPLPAVGDPPLGAGGRIFRLEMPRIAVSSSRIRQRRAAGEPLDDLVPARVARYIQRHGLYEEGPR